MLKIQNVKKLKEKLIYLIKKKKIIKIILEIKQI